MTDLDLAGGHVDDAFGRLLDLFAQLPSDQRAPVRERLVELFGLIGAEDPRVVSARNVSRRCCSRTAARQAPTRDQPWLTVGTWASDW